MNLSSLKLSCEAGSGLYISVPENRPESSNDESSQCMSSQPRSGAECALPAHELLLRLSARDSCGSVSSVSFRCRPYSLTTDQ